MTEPVEPLDPDQIACRKCHAQPGEVCRQPDGSRARQIHTPRRRDAAAGKIPQLPDKSEPQGPSPATPEGRSKGGKASAQARRRRQSEIAARVEAQRAAAEEAALQAEAEKLAKSAAQYAHDRAELRRLTLGNALKSAQALDEAITHRRRPVGFTEDGKPRTVQIEVFDQKTGLPAFDKEGERVLREEVELVGWHSIDTIVDLSKAAAQNLASVRLEEGKPTGIHEHQTGGAAEILGEHETAALIAFAAQHFTEPEGGTA